jgi:AcrR family transcriptional regulator
MAKVSPEVLDGRREDILRSAYRLFGEKGYPDTNIQDIAADLKIAHGTFYRYFKNKLDVFIQVVDLVIAEIAGVVSSEDPEASCTLEEYRRQIERIGNRFFDLFVADQHLALLLFYQAPGIDRGLDERIRLAMDLFGEFSERYLINGCKRGFLRADLDTRTTAFAVNAMIFEGVRRVQQAPHKERARDAWMRALSSLMLHGMAA